MGISVTTVLTDHTWDTAVASWDEMGQLEKTWEGAVIIATTLNTDDPIALLDSSRFNISEVIAEAFATAEASGKSILLLEPEAMSLIDAAGTISSFLPKIQESFVTTDAVGNAVERPVIELMSMAESISKAFQATEAESLSVAEDFGKLINYGVLVAEAFGLGEAVASEAGKAFFDTFATVETYAQSIGLSQSESVAIAEVFARAASFIVAFQEIIGAADACRNAYAMVESESFTTAEAFGTVAQFMPIFAESISIAESYQDTINFMISIMESVTIAEADAFGTSKPVAETLGFVEADALQMGASYSEALAIAESCAFQFLTAYYEAVGIAEMSQKDISNMQAELLSAQDVLKSAFVSSQADAFGLVDDFSRIVSFIAKFAEAAIVQSAVRKSAGKPVAEVLSVIEQQSKSFGQNIAELVATMDVIGRVVEFNRNCDEGFSTADAAGKAMAMSMQEAMRLADEYLRPGVGVYNQADLYSRALNDSEFKALLLGDSPMGYGPFRQFVPGEYEYQEAIVRLAMASRDIDRAAVTELGIDIDVEDVIEKGSYVFATAGAKRINFTRRFLVPPEVTISTKGGTAGVVAIPKIIGQVQRTYFDVILENTSGQAVTGAISWSAVAY